jgi:ubiquinone/menaquinone biosynthesis C-methylase UbiE
MLARLKQRARQRYVEIIMQAISQYLRETGTADANIKILDVGAENCWLLHSLPLKCTKVAIDISPHHQFDDDNFPRFLAEDFAYFVLADAVHMPFPDNTFDCVFSNEFVSHVYDIDKVIAEQIRVLKRAAPLIIMDANFANSVNFILNFLVDWLRSRGKLGGLRWLFHRDKPFYIKIPTKQGAREVKYKSENTHSRHWWALKMSAYNKEIKSEVSIFCSFSSISLPLLSANKILVVGHKL